MIKIIIGNVTSKLVGHLPENVHLEIDSYLSYILAGSEHSLKVKKGYWDGVIHLYYKDKGQSFYTGLLSIVCEILTKHEIPFKKVDRRVRPEQNLPFLECQPPAGFQERDYQDFTVSRSISKTRGILKMATGGGKTLTVAQIIGELKTAPFIFYVLTKDLMDQAYDALSSTLNVPIGRVGGGHLDIRDINVCTIQTVIRALNDKNNKFKISDYLFDDEDIWDENDLLNAEKVHAIRTLLGAAKGLYLDEMHHAAARTVREVLSASPKAYWRYGGTATPYREDNSELVLQGLFGKKIVDISASYLIEKGYLLKPYILFDPITHAYVPKAYQSVYSTCVTKNDDFHAHVAKTANHMIGRGLSTLILVKHYAHGNALKSLIPDTEFVTGKLTSKRRREAIQDLREKKSMCMIATTLADEGLDIPSLDAALLAGGGASPTRVNQRVGRTLRPDRSSANPRDKSIVVSYDHKAKYLSKQHNNTKKILKLEPQFELINSLGGDYILGEIDEIMGTGERSSIFDI
jgi:superfamily II DNA or RNA helicase